MAPAARGLPGESVSGCRPGLVPAGFLLVPHRQATWSRASGHELRSRRWKGCWALGGSAGSRPSLATGTPRVRCPGVFREVEDASGQAGAGVLPCGVVGRSAWAVPGEERGDVSAWPLFLLTAHRHSSGSCTPWHLLSAISCSQGARFPRAFVPSLKLLVIITQEPFHLRQGVKHVVAGRVVPLWASGGFTGTHLRARRSH